MNPWNYRVHKCFAAVAPNQHNGWWITSGESMNITPNSDLHSSFILHYFLIQSHCYTVYQWQIKGKKRKKEYSHQDLDIILLQFKTTEVELCRFCLNQSVAFQSGIDF